MEDKENKNEQISLNKNQLKIFGIIFLIVVIGGYYVFNNYQKTQNLVNSQQQALDATNQELQKVEGQVTQAQQTANQADTVSQAIPNIISEWGPVIPIIVCNFRDVNGTILETSQGSSILFQNAEGSNRVLTNQHVVSNGTNIANDCEVQFPNDSQIFTAPGSEIGTAPNGADAAQVVITNSDSYINGLISNSQKKFCSTEPSVGDEVVILGYPAIGASSGITATDGIISGYDGDYYVTSAKVDHGNSGGAAIDVKNDCDLGIPTYVISGQLESLARILKWQATAPGASEQRAANDKL